MSAPAPRHCVIVPFYGRLAMVARCVELLRAGALPSTQILLVDDGSEPSAMTDPAIRHQAADPRVHIVRHPVNRGVAAARNTALDWCRRAGIEIVLMIDSDCEPPPEFVAAHLRLHAAHPEAALIGAAIEGVGTGFWAGLDRVMTWVHCMPWGGVREVKHPYHLTTTNLSLKMRALPPRAAVFDERLCTGEDALLVRELRAQGHGIWFFPAPRVLHRDRDTWRGVLWHHYQYGQHQYFVQLGGDLSPRCFHPLYRALFCLGFVPVAPLFALAGSVLNLWPWLRHRPGYAAYFPLMYLLWLAKSVAVLEAAAMPSRVLRPVAPPVATPAPLSSSAAS